MKKEEYTITSVRSRYGGQAVILPKPDLSWTQQPAPSKSRLRRALWRWRVWIEATFVLSMLEPWEKFMLVSFFTLLNLLLLAGIIVYFPAHLYNMQSRASYYLWGAEDVITTALLTSAANMSFWGH